MTQTVTGDKSESVERFVPQRQKRVAKKKILKDSPKLTFFDRLLRFSLKYTYKSSRILSSRLPQLRRDIERSNLHIAAEGIIALAMLFTYITIPFVAIGIYILYKAGLGLPILALPVIIALPVILMLNIPKISASSRSSVLDNELPYVVGYITVLAGGGISPFVTLKRLAKADAIFPAAAKEARRILLDIEIFGMDAISALEKVSRVNPNKMFADFIGGYVAVLKTGGDALSYLESKLKEIFSYAETKVRRGSEFIGTMAEAYIIVTVVMGISIMILWSTQNLLGGVGSIGTTGSQTLNVSIIVLFSGVMVPVISLVFIIVIGSAQTKEPFSFDLPFYVFLASLPVVVVTYLVPFGLPQYLQLGIGLAIATTPAAIIQMKYVRQKKSVESKLSNFLRDISEIRKTGLAPEKTIEQLADRNYAGLSEHVQRISSQLSWGTPIRTVLQNFGAVVKSWLTRAMAFLLLEVVDVGGGSPKMFTDLADFTEKNAMLQSERRSMVRPFMMIPYVGAIMVVVTTAMMIYFVDPPGLSSLGITLASKSLIAKATNILLMCSFFQAWVMGFVAGKMGEESAADGFKHATLLVVLSLIAVYVSFTLISGMKF
ncbi:MAG: type II secretion system F family protein [Nitrososphaerota archaeon]|nr:type II secretion system F family protein [Nitrososphaerota archaeon]